MTRLLAAAVIAGAVMVAAGAALVYPPAGIIIGGGELLAMGLLYRQPAKAEGDRRSVSTEMRRAA